MKKMFYELVRPPNLNINYLHIERDYAIYYVYNIYLYGCIIQYATLMLSYVNVHSIGIMKCNDEKIFP